MDPAVIARRDKLKRITCLSIDDIREIRSAWKCSSTNCWRLESNHGSTEFGPFKDDSKPPIILTCGHYLCDECAKGVEDWGAYNCGIPRCNYHYEKEDNVDKFPRARHIKEYVNMFRGLGLPCYECRNGGYIQESNARKRSRSPLQVATSAVKNCLIKPKLIDPEKDMITAEHLTYNHHIDMMAVCYTENCSNLVYSVMTDLKEHVETNKIDITAKLLCLICAAKNHSTHGNMRRITNDRLSKGLRELLGDKYYTEEIKEDTTVLPKERFPWNLITTSTVNTKMIIGNLLRCYRCLDPFIASSDASKDRSPVFLSCGHLVCKVCRGSMKDNNNENCKRCNRPPEEGVKVKQLPADIEYLVNLNIDQYRECTRCEKYFPPSDYVVRSNGEIWCVIHHLFVNFDVVGDNSKMVTQKLD
ncbi:hypothetical protein PFISCL1PPCAC_16024 [Pristionchus fissidentatus]|uniref:RING-type domain-containing protein n=1 Tax=Pristionchus fissidentatus TaxID=1538716 RepID=A0AAV5VYP3_9BILA|nr:hypothetical protein PFISCL1PPCAC_16024 [Pristionchus fissidentatus]